LHRNPHIKDPEQLAAIAADRKPSMMLLPYGIPIAIGTIVLLSPAVVLSDTAAENDNISDWCFSDQSEFMRNASCLIRRVCQRSR
jgi:hypothetical protein